ncbi:MAG: RidA family protein [Lautropia sp.]
MSETVRLQRNARMSQVVVHGAIAYLSGQVPPGFLDGSPPVAVQTQQVLARIDELLAAAGTSKSRLLTAQVLLADVAEFDAMNAVWERWIDPAHPPARTTCGAVLAHPNVRVEITVSAAL